MLAGFRFLRGRRELWPFCVVPLLLNLCVFALAIVVFTANLDAFSTALRGTLDVGVAEAWYEWLWIGPLRLLGWLVRWLLIAVFAFAVYFLFTVVGAVYELKTGRVRFLHRSPEKKNSKSP